MTRVSRQSWRYAALFTLVVFAVFSALPIWTAWYFSSWEGLGELASFWTMLASIPQAAEQVNTQKLILTFYGPEVVKLAVLLVMSLVRGRWWGGRRLGR